MSERFKNIAKGGWHPEKNRADSSGAESTSRLGQVKGRLMNRGGNDSHVEQARQHQSAPLSTLKDPSTFAPPPKRLDYNADPTASRPAPTAPPTGSAKQRLQEREEARRREEEEANRPPAGPYRPDTTGLSTAHLPKPPAFRPTVPSPPPTTNNASKPKPSLPPRLPPRQNSNPNEFAPAPPPTYNEATTQETPSMINQGAMSRLGRAGVSVPGFNIGRTASPPVPARHNPSPPIPPRQIPSSARTPIAPPPPATRGPQLGELQNRFAKLSTGSSAEETAPTSGTSWADKQAALRTASSLREDPSKVTANDLKGASSTANNFQQRHGAQVASGFKAANGLNQKYGLAGRVNNFASSSASSAPTQPTPPQSPIQSGPGGFGKKLAPPAPPKKKELGGTAGEPPPIPLGSKPKF